MSVSTTTLMPLDPAISPEHVNRVLPIRANLLPDEITSGRSARRARLLVAIAIVLVIAVLGAWYLFANLQRNEAADDLAAVTAQVDRTRKETKKEEYTKVTDVINESGTITKQLYGALATDLPWATLTDAIRTTGTRKRITVTSIIGSLAKDQKAGTGPTAAIGLLTVAGSAPDKKTIAGYVDALGDVDGIANVYLTAANQDGGSMTFTLTADITGKSLCGRFTTGCKSGGK
jgi:hypothetical protein